MNPNAIPPAPPAHLPRTRPGEPPYIIHHPNHPANSAHLAHQMGQLNLGTERGHQNAQAPPVLSDNTPLYEGYTFFKAKPTAGQEPTWNRTERAKMALSQNELFAFVQKRANKVPILKQYAALSQLKRGLVDQLIEEHRRGHPHLHWECVYVKANERLVTSQNSRPGDYETVLLDVVVLGRPIPASNPKAPDEYMNVEIPGEGPKSSQKLDQPLVKQTPRQSHALENGVRWIDPENPTPRKDSPPPPRPQPPPPHPGGPFPPVPHPIQDSIMDERQTVERTWPVGAPVWAQQPMQQPIVVPGAVMTFPTDSNMHYPGQMRAYGHPGPAQTAGDPRVQTQPSGTGLMSHPGQMPNHVHFEQIPPAHEPHEKSNIPEGNKDCTVEKPKSNPGFEFTWSPDSSDSENESILSDDGNESSMTEESGKEDNEKKALAKPQPWRGSLYRQDSSARLNRRKPVYRIHRRKSLNGTNEDDGRKRSRSRNLTGSMKLVPANNTKVAQRQPREITVQGTRRPTIVHEPDVSPVVLNAEVTPPDEKKHGGRVRNDVRTQILNEREARLEMRENLFEHRVRMLAEALGVRHLNRHMSPHPRRRLLPDIS